VKRLYARLLLAGVAVAIRLSATEEHDGLQKSESANEWMNTKQRVQIGGLPVQLSFALPVM